MSGPVRTVGAKVVLDGEKEFKEAIARLNQENKVLASEMRKLKAEYKGNTESTEYLTKAGKLLDSQLQQQREKVKYLQDQLAAATSAQKQNVDQINKLKIALNNAEAEEFKLKHAIEENTAALQGQGKEMTGLGDAVDKLADKFGINLPEGATKALNGIQSLSAGTVAAMAATAAAIAAAVKSVEELGKITLEVAAQVDEYLTQSAITGVPTAMLQAWDYAAPLIDTDAETIKGAMVKITQAMGDAANGSESAQEKFAALGVSIYDEADGSLRSAEEVFYDIVDALSQMQDGTERNALAMELLGKNAQELNPLFNAGSSAIREYAKEAESAGYILDEYQIKKLAEVDDEYQKMLLTIEATKRQIAAEFAPAAKEAMELFSDVVRKAGKALVDSGIIDGIGEVMISLSMTVQQVLDLLGLTDTIPGKLSPVADALYELADLIARINDGFSFFSGLFKTGSIFTMKEGFQQMKNSLGFGYGSGNPNNQQKMRMIHEGTYGQYSDFYGIGNNATGTENWRGGLTWVGETGPELVDVPQGSRIYSATESAAMMGEVTVNQVFHINVDDLQDLQKLISWGKTAAANARVMNRMDPPGLVVCYPNLA